MNLTKNCLSKYYIKRILIFILPAAVIAAILLEIGILLPGQMPSLNLASVDIFKISAPDPLEPPQECLNQPADGYSTSWTCFKSYFERITNEVSANAAMAEARRFKSQKVISDCHLFAHFIGENTLEKYDFDIGEALSSCAAGCSSGCYHGVLERYIRDEPDLPNLLPQLKAVCDAHGVDDRSRYRCVHGIGHGLFAHNYLPPLDAVNGCDSFGGQWREVCIGGLTMENMDEYLLLDLDEEQFRKILPEICAPFESLAKVRFRYIGPDVMESCIIHIAQGLLFYTGYDIERTEELCEELSRQGHIDDCKEAIGRAVAKSQPSNIDIEKFFENHEVF